jgi:hypothetical protein
MKRVLSFFILCLLLCSCSFSTKCGGAQDTSCTRVLFIGNSYTFVNDLPNTFAKLARSGGHKVEVGMSAQGGWTLAQHNESPETLRLLNSTKWNFVVLQEQSQIPSVEAARTQGMYPAARALVQKVNAIGAAPVFFITWAHRGGFPQNGMDYASMQNQINYGYTHIAQELRAMVAPVGPAWSIAVEKHPELSLWQEDGSHPSETGTYLAACVFYAVIFHESPEELSYRADLPKETAKILQTVASQIALKTP